MSAEDRWISVEERLPEYGSVCLVYGYDIDDVEKIPYQDISGYSYHGSWDSRADKSSEMAITHWMPLPSPPTFPRSSQKETADSSRSTEEGKDL